MATSAEITVLAGTNGAGKSSVAGAALRRRGGTFYNPDEATREYLAAGLGKAEANARAWHNGREQLERAIKEHRSYAFETTLGGRTITRLLLLAVDEGLHVRIWYVGLRSAELHIERVRRRVMAGGHDIPEARIRERWDASRRNLIRLLPHAREVVVYDNSADADPARGEVPTPQKLLHVRDAALHFVSGPEHVAAWAKPILAAALERYGSL